MDGDIEKDLGVIKIEAAFKTMGLILRAPKEETGAKAC